MVVVFGDVGISVLKDNDVCDMLDCNVWFVSVVDGDM